MYKRLLKVAMIVLSVIAGLVALGALYNNVKYAIDARHHPPPGMLVDVGDHTLHIHCEGSGSPTVVLEAGAGAWSFAMANIQARLRDSLRVCSYDRAGLGWSESSGSDFDAGSSVTELRTLVDSAGVVKPFVLVGHSLGANIAQVYAARHPEELYGVVLIDPGTPDDLLEGFTGTDSAALAITSCGWKCGTARGVARLGLVRFAARKAGRKRLSDSAAKAYRANVARPRVVNAAVGTLAFLPKTGVQTRQATQFGELPVTVLFTENTREPVGKETPLDVEKWHALKLEQMRTLLKGTTRGRGPLIVPGATHMSVLFEPQSAHLIADETLRLARSRNRPTPH